MRSFAAAFRAVVAGIVVAMMFLLVPAVAQDAQGLARILAQATKQGAKLADEIPLRRFENFAGTISRQADDIAQGAARQGDEVAEAAVRSAARSLRQTDEVLFRQIDSLPAPEKAVALRVYHGADILGRQVGDSQRAARIIEQAGPEGLEQIARYGDDLAVDFQQIDGAVMSRTLRVPGEKSAIHLFTENVAAAGSGTLHFWRSYIGPNWKKIAGGGLIAAFIYDPEKFVDVAGNATEHAAQEFGRLGVEVVIGGGTGFIKGFLIAMFELATGSNAWAFWSLTIVAGFFLFRRVLQRDAG